MHLTAPSAHSVDDIRIITRIYFYGVFLKAIRDESYYRARRINLGAEPA